jgi:hypothetical protein
MKRLRFLPLILFLYDSARLVMIVGIFTQLGKVSLFDGLYPYLVFASSQTLFPIMTWFIYLDAEKHHTYLPLNITGKCINIVLSGVWAFSTGWELSGTMSFDIFICLGLTLIIIFTDIMSILGMIFLKKGLNQSFQNQSEIDSEVNASDGGTECE